MHDRLRASTLALFATLSLTAIAAAQDAASTNGDAGRCDFYPAPSLPELTPVAAASGTVSAESEFGAVEIPVAPGAALGMYTTDVDMLIWLGYPLADSQPIRGDNGYETFPCFFPPVSAGRYRHLRQFPRIQLRAHPVGRARLHPEWAWL